MRAIFSAAAIVVGGTLAVGATTLNFDTGNTGSTSAGTITGNEFTDFGVDISVSGGTSQLALFNSNCGPDFPGTPCTGGDPDLASGPEFGTSPQGRVLIGQEPNAPTPDDLYGSYTFTFAFSPIVELTSISLLDLDEGEFSGQRSNVVFTRFFADGSTAEDFSSTLTHSIIGSGDNSLATFSFGERDVTRLDVSFQRISGAISAVDFTPMPIPVPAALPLLGAGLAALYVVRRRRRA